MKKQTRISRGHSVATVTPAKAHKWLGTVSGNRNVSRTLVQHFARDMEKGRWALNGEPLIFDWNGCLRDGQHRCHACVMADASFKTFVSTGIDPATFDTIDTGRNRIMSDVLAIEGFSNSYALASSLTYLHRYFTGEGDLTPRGPLSRPTVREREEILMKHPNVTASIAPVVSARVLAPKGLMAALHYLFAARDSALADIFFEALGSGTGLTSQEPVYRLREQLMNNRAANKKLPVTDVAAYIIKTWNATRNGKVLKNLRYSPKGDKPEKFPEIK